MTKKSFLILMKDNTSWILETDPEQGLKLYRHIDWINGKDAVISGNAVNDWLEQSGADLDAIYPIENNSVNFEENNILEYSELLDDVQ